MVWYLVNILALSSIPQITTKTTKSLPVEHDVVGKKIRQETLNNTYRKPEHQKHNGAKDNLQ